MIHRDPKVCARHLTKTELKQVAEYAKKFGQVKTMEHFNLSRSPIIRAMKIHGVKSWANGRPREYTDEDRRQWRKFKGSLHAAAIFFGVSRSTIRHALDKTKKRQR